MAETKRRILIVDDDPDFRFQQRVHLERAGFAVIEAEGLDKARLLVREGAFDLAMVDLMMEEFDAGFTLCHEIKKKNAGLPVIMITGVKGETGLDFDAATQEERSWIKADALLAKPVRPDQLLREVNRLLRG